MLGDDVESDASSTYLSRECIDNACICDSKPRLSNIKEDDDMFYTKLLTLHEIMMISDSKALADYESAQYKAACWVLHDDPFFYENSLELENRKERMMQRYLLALFFFTMGPEKWNDHFYFLSSKSECDWNQVERDESGQQVFIGIGCDENDYVIAIKLGKRLTLLSFKLKF